MGVDLFPGDEVRWTQAGAGDAATLTAVLPVDETLDEHPREIASRASTALHPAKPKQRGHSSGQPLHKSSRRRRWLVTMAALTTMGSGAINLYSLMGVDVSPNAKFIREVFPLEFLHLTRFLTMLTGFALVMVSLNILKRKHRAWECAILLGTLSFVFHLTKGLDYVEAGCSALLVILLLVTHREFTVRSGAPDWPEGILKLAVAFLIAIVYGVAGFWLLDKRDFGVDFTFGDSVHKTLLFLSMVGDPEVAPRTWYARWFFDSLSLMTMTSVVVGIAALFRPALYQLRTHPQEEALARRIAARHGRTTLDYFKSWPDKSFFFSATGHSFLAYGVSSRCALVLGDPVGPDEEMESLIRSFIDACRENDWRLGFYQTLPDYLALYQKLGFHKLKIGDEAIVDLAQFTLDGKAHKEERSRINQLEKQGYRLVSSAPPLASDVLENARKVSDEWLQIRGRRERKFTTGKFDETYLAGTPMAGVVDPAGRLDAFVNLVPSSRPREFAIDLMRRRKTVANGMMDYLLAKLLLLLKSQGAERLNLGLAPMSGFKEREEASAEERAVHYFFQRLNFIFSYRGLYRFKAKFAHVWEPRYMIYQRAVDLPLLVRSLARLSNVGVS